MLFNIIMPSCHTILVGCWRFGVGSDLSAGLKENKIEYFYKVPSKYSIRPDKS